jgi:hypothetical protein
MEFGDNKGDVWEIFYYNSKRIEIPESEKQKFIDDQTRELGNTFNPPPGLSPADYSNLFLNHFLKTRNESRELLDKSTENRIRLGGYFQVGNKECLDDLRKIESNSNFQGWENPDIVSFFRTISEMHL